MIKNVLLILSCLISFTFILLPQSLNELESRYENLRNGIQKENLILDSLKSVLENRAHQIENEKQKQKPDNDKIVKLMAGSVSLSNSIEHYQGKLEESTKNLNRIIKGLDNKYSVIIDSLKLLKKSSKENLEKIDDEILFFTKNKLLISPQVEMLSFNPEKILQIDLNKAKSSEEKLSLTEYLSSALSEVNKLLTEVDSQLEEADEALTLQKKTSKFLSETEFDRDIRFQNLSKSTITNTQGVSSLTGDSRESIADQFYSYMVISDQLNIFDKSKNVSSRKFSLQTDKSNLSLKDYSNLLKEVMKKLTDYKLVLTNKLEQPQ